MRIIQSLLGHSLITTTAMYTRVSPQLIQRTASPLDHLKPRFHQKSKPKAHS